MKRNDLALGAIGTVSLLLTLLFVSNSMAVTPKDPPQTVDIGLPSEEVPSAYRSGKVIIKFKDDAEAGAVAAALLERGQSFESITGEQRLDKIVKKFGVTAMNKVFSSSGAEDKIPPGRISKASAQSVLSESKSRERKRSEKVLEAKSKKASGDLPYLSGTYVVEFSEGTVEDAVEAFKESPLIEYAQPDY